MVVRFHPESRMASSPPGGGVGFIRRARRVRSPGLLPRCGSTWLERAVRDRETGGSNPLTSTTNTWRAAHLGVIAVLQAACAGFDSLARYDRFRPVSTAAVQLPDKRPTEVRTL